MGYPSWEQLASFAVELVTTEQRGHELTNLNKAMKNRDFPAVFQEAQKIVGGPRLIQHLRDNNKPSAAGKIYDLITQWPIPVYLTTNYDDELQNHLAKWGEAYTIYTNTADHFGMIAPSLDGAIVKLHGDLRSESGLILTKDQYDEIKEGEHWKYWRTRMTSIFQMNPVVIIGHSLSDKNIRHVLEAAKEGSNVEQPICWLAPDVTYQQCKELLDNYKIRVIPYDNRDGQHKNLVRLIENISDFIPPRTVIGIQDKIKRVSSSPLGDNAAAPGFFVYNIFAEKGDYEEKRIDIVIGAIKSTLPELSKSGDFALKDALNISGWPIDLPVESEFLKQINKHLIEDEVLVPTNGKYRVNNKALSISEENRKQFDHVKGRFKNALVLRLKRDYSGLTEPQINTVASDIEASLVGYFREGGLSLASTLFSSRRYGDVPTSIIPFIALASAKYDDLLMRQAFFVESVAAFAHPTGADKDYLGRISQGFFAFHALGVFGDVAIERLKDARSTVWLVDSSAQIGALALAAPANAVYRECFTRLKSIGIRFFTTYSLFKETLVHLWFADNVIKANGPDSPLLIAAARGEPPYSKPNEFLQGFIMWQAAGNRCDWYQYLYDIIGTRKFNEEAIINKLKDLGIEVVALNEWPGFEETDCSQVEESTDSIAKVWEEKQLRWSIVLSDQITDPYEKAKPEAEALIVVRKERDGSYYIISEKGGKSPSWFISYTSMLNIVEPGLRITWQPEAFLRFSSTLCDISDEKSVDQAFESLILGLAQSGVNLLDEDIIARVFGSAIDQTTLSMHELSDTYHAILAEKYGEEPEVVLNRILPSYRPLAAMQLANEATMVAEKKQKIAEEAEKEAKLRAETAEIKLGQFDRYRKKMEARKQRAKAKTKKRKHVKKGKRKRKK